MDGARFRGVPLSSDEIERHFPHGMRIIMRGRLSFHERGALNVVIEGLGEHRNGSFNGIEHHRFQRAAQAAMLAEFVASNRMDRLVPDSTDRPTPEEVAAAWQEIARANDAILAWARAVPGRLQEVVQTYRFERRQGAFSYSAHIAASRTVAALDPSIGDAMNYAGVLIEWAEREHRAWFWRCCRNHHVL